MLKTLLILAATVSPALASDNPMFDAMVQQSLVPNPMMEQQIYQLQQQQAQQRAIYQLQHPNRPIVPQQLRR